MKPITKTKNSSCCCNAPKKIAIKPAQCCSKSSKVIAGCHD